MSTCENSKIESLCNLIHADKHPALQKLQLQKICDFNFDLLNTQVSFGRKRLQLRTNVLSWGVFK